MALGHEGLVVTSYHDPFLSDSIQVSFSLPHYKGNLHITVYTNSLEAYKLDYTEKHKELMLPSHVKSFTFYIEPDHIMPHTNDGLFYGILGFLPFQDYTIGEGNNCISIVIPAITNSFFERYYIKGEYVKVSKGSITWKGQRFVKRN